VRHSYGERPAGDGMNDLPASGQKLQLMAQAAAGLDPERDSSKAVRSVVDVIRRLLGRRAGIAAWFGSWAHGACGVPGKRSGRSARRVDIVVIDPSVPSASGIRAALSDASIAVDGWQLVALADQMVTKVGSGSPARAGLPRHRPMIRCG